MAVFYREHYLHADEMRAPEAYVDSVCSAGNGTSDDLRGKKPQGEKKTHIGSDSTFALGCRHSKTTDTVIGLWLLGQ